MLIKINQSTNQREATLDAPIQDSKALIKPLVRHLTFGIDIVLLTPLVKPQPTKVLIQKQTPNMNSIAMYHLLDATQKVIAIETSI